MCSLIIRGLIGLKIKTFIDVNSLESLKWVKRFDEIDASNLGHCNNPLGLTIKTFIDTNSLVYLKWEKRLYDIDALDLGHFNNHLRDIIKEKNYELFVK